MIVSTIVSLFRPYSTVTNTSKALIRGMLAVWVSAGLSWSAHADSYWLAAPEGDLIGEVQVVKAREQDTLMDVARAHRVGISELRLANPDVDVWLPREGTPVTIPSRFLLPDAPRQGLVLNLAELRLYHFSHGAAGEPRVATYPVGIGRDDRQTPVGSGRVVMKLQNPAWYPTEAVRADYAARGKILPRQVPAGPNNPLGEYALVLDLPGILIHGTNKPDGIGLRVSQGCIRLYPEDIAYLVHQVEKGSPVTIVDQPFKVGIADGELLVEVHPPVYADLFDTELLTPVGTTRAPGEQQLVKQVVELLTKRGDEITGSVDWERLTQVYQRADGMPTAVTGMEVEELPPSRAGR